MLETTLGQAIDEYGDTLVISANGAIEKGPDPDDPVRVIHDGSNGVLVNHFIRVRDQLTTPVASDIKRTLREMARFSPVRFGVAADAKDAHRTIMVRPEDWRFQGTRLKNGSTTYVHMCQNYGVASAASSPVEPVLPPDGLPDGSTPRYIAS